MGVKLNIVPYDAPPPSDLQQMLETSDMVWVLSSCATKLTQQHHDKLAQSCFNGKPLYLIADNYPCVRDVSPLAQLLFNMTFDGDEGIRGKQLSSCAAGKHQACFEKHAITHGLHHMAEGDTVSHIHPLGTPWLYNATPVLWSSKGHALVQVVEPHAVGGCRAILDGGGLTRIVARWGASTERWIMNSFAWLAST